MRHSEEESFFSGISRFTRNRMSWSQVDYTTLPITDQRRYGAAACCCSAALLLLTGRNMTSCAWHCKIKWTSIVKRGEEGGFGVCGFRSML